MEKTDLNNDSIKLDFWRAYSIPFKEALINEWVPDETHRDILKKRLCDNLTYDELAFEFDRTPIQMRNIVVKELTMLKEHIHENDEPGCFKTSFNLCIDANGYLRLDRIQAARA